jgi:hypothetical protein
MAVIHVSLEFARLPDPELDEFASNVITKMTGNAAFATPAVPLAALTALQGAFHTALAATTQGGTMATASKNNARAALVGALRQEAAYVETTSGGNLTTLLSSGFVQRGTPGASTQLAQPVIKSVRNGMSTQLILQVQPVDNARSYEVQVRNGTGGWQPAVIATKARGIIVPGLTPGQMYDVQVRAIGGSTGYSDWSDHVSHMCM